MEKHPGSVLANVVGASTALAGIVLAAPCSGGGCLACLRCASLGAGVALATLLFRSVSGREKRLSPSLAAEQIGLPAEQKRSLTNAY